MDVVARYPGNSKRGNKSPERASECLSLDLFLKEDIRMQRCGKRSTFKEINYKASRSEIESPIICTSITKNESTAIESFWTKSDTRMDELEYKKKGEHNKDWDQLRKNYSRSREKNDDNMDVVDWESVRQATVDELADTIKKRGMNYILAKKMKVIYCLSC